MSSFFKIDVRVITVVVVYLTLIYTTVYCFSAVGTDAEFGVITPDVVPDKVYKVSSNEQNASDDANSGWFVGIVGFILGVLTVLSVPVTFGMTLPLAVAVVGSFTLGGALIGVGVSKLGRALDVEIPFSGFLEGVKGFLGAILDLFVFIGGFLTFGLIADTGLVVPDSFAWLLFFMVFPVWLYFLVISAGFAVEAWKAVKAW